MRDWLSAILFISALTWGIGGYALSGFYFDEVKRMRSFVVCDLFMLILFGPVCWIMLVVFGIVLLFEDCPGPTEWAAFVGKHCIFKKKNDEV